MDGAGHQQAVDHLERSLIDQGKLLKAVTQERDRLQKELKKAPDKASTVDYMLKATKCKINFLGWEDLRKIKGKSERKGQNVGTDIKGVDKELYFVDNRNPDRVVTDE